MFWLLQLPQPVQQAYNVLHHLNKTCSLLSVYNQAISTVRVVIVSLTIITLLTHKITPSSTASLANLGFATTLDDTQQVQSYSMKHFISV